MKKLTMRQKIWGFLLLILVVCVAVSSLILNQTLTLEKVERDFSDRQQAMSEQMILIAQANHAVSKTASSFKNVMIRGLVTKDREKYAAEFVKYRDKFSGLTEEIRALMLKQDSPDLLAKLDQFIQSYGDVWKKYNDVLIQYDGTDPLAYIGFDRMVRGIDRPVVTEGRELEHMIREAREQLAGERDKAISTAFNFAELSLVGGFGLVLVICASLLLGFGESIRSILGAEPTELKAITTKIAKGDLSANGHVGKKIKAGSVLESFDTMRTGLISLINQILTSSSGLEQSMKQVQVRLESLTTSSASQAETSSSMAAGIEQMSVSISQVSDAAVQSSGAASSSAESAEKGMSVMKSTSAEFAETAEGSRRLSARIGLLGEQSRKITRIIQVIEEIAAQTNLLALNAAIEAARAGEQGRGFAVVADEVRQLAERTTQSTTEIETMVSAIQKGTEEAVVDMNQWSSRTEEGLGRVMEAESLMGTIKSEAETVMRMISEVDSALREQSTASQQIANHVEKVSSVSEENSMSILQIDKNLKTFDQLLAGLVKQTKHFNMG